MKDRVAVMLDQPLAALVVLLHRTYLTVGPSTTQAHRSWDLRAQGRGAWIKISSRAPHAVPAVEAAVAGAAADGQGAAVVAGGGVALEVGELAVLLAEVDGVPDFDHLGGGRGLRGRGLGTHDGLGVLEVGDGRAAVAVDLEHRGGG